MVKLMKYDLYNHNQRIHTMRRTFIRITGFALILASIAGLLFSLAGIFGIWTVQRNLTESLTQTVDLIDLTLETTTQGLTVVNDSLIRANTDVRALSTTLQTTGRAIRDTNPMIVEVSGLVADEIPDSILKMQTALTSAQASARLIERTLTLIGNIPLMPAYNPPVPLDMALGEVVASLDAIPESLSAVETSLNTSRGNLIMIEAEFNIMARHINDINTSLTDARVVITQYQEVVSVLHEQVTTVQTNLPAWMDTATWFITVGLVWLGLTQLGLLAQGFEMVALRTEPALVVEAETGVVREET
jgi:methyl-accepting chemotaxis protein